MPLLHSDSPCTHDGAFHYYRVAAMRHALRDGILFTRYLPDLAFGYGYPFFNYRAALSYYLALALHLTGLSLPVTLNLIYVLSIIGSAIAAYLLARDLFGSEAGILAAVAYAYAPYQFLDALLRANMPESVALPLMPLILWAFRRLVLTGQRRWFLVSVGSLAALHLTHNISFLLFTPLLLAYLALLWLVYRREGHWVAAIGAFALAWGLTAFFWGPALLEQDYAQLHMSHVTRNNDFHYNFLNLAEIFAPPTPVDTALMNPPMRIHLGLVQAILAGIGLVTGLIRWRDQEHKERRATLIFLTLAAILMLWMTTSSSLWLWEHLPLLPFVQFPWRLVGRAILPIALLAGASASPPSTSTQRISRFTFYAIIGLLILSALPSTYPPRGYCSSVSHPTISDVFAYERQSKLVGVDPEGSYFPIWVKQRPDPDEGSPLEAQYEAGGPITRFDEAALPTGAAVVEADYGSNQAHLVVETPAPFRARYLAFYFPGWRVEIDGESVETTATDPEGFITFDVPAGRHTIVVRFGSTPLRTTFTVISLLSLATLLILALRYPHRPPPATPHKSRPTPDVSHLPSHVSRFTFHVSRFTSDSSLFTFYTLTATALLLFKLTVVDRADTIFRRPTLQLDGTLPRVEHVLNQPYADSMTLIGYDQVHTTIPADGELRLDLYWTAGSPPLLPPKSGGGLRGDEEGPPTARYQTVIHLVGAGGMRWSLPDTFRPRGYADYPPTNTWSPGHYALDSHAVVPLPGTPPGVYDVVLTTFDRDTLTPLSVLNEQGQPTAPELTLGQVTLTAPDHPATLGSLPIRHRLAVSLGPLTLLGADFDRDEAAPGDQTLLTTFWHAEEQPPDDLTLHLALLAPDGFTAAEYEETRFLGKNLVSAGDVWRGQHLLRLPTHLEDGDHTWRLTLLPIDQSTNLPSTIHITAPSRTFTPPPVTIETNTRLGDVATLLGASHPITQSPSHPVTQSPSHPVTITLVWRAETETSTSYHVFLHLLDSEGKLVAQSDTIPANWSRPTTGWLPGEYITDVHTLT
ncbi:MAG: glycosyltransferase family 39 protein, partial [Chloroflexota bacterium]|nr:glycosyltransferase family 39 protein [Chloroflexota bacterium]